MPTHVIAVTTHNKPPPHTFLAQILRVTNGVPTGSDRSLYHIGEKPRISGEEQGWERSGGGQRFSVTLEVLDSLGDASPPS